MHVFVFIREEGRVLHLWGRTDGADSERFKVPVQPGESFCGLSFNELEKIEWFDTDPATGQVTASGPRRPALENSVSIPEFLLKPRITL